MKKLLISTLNHLSSQFAPNELAFLSLTTKIELPFRDRWSFLLHEESKGEMIVSREWRRTDIAILKKQKPLALIELKAMYTFDAVLIKDGVIKYNTLMDNDIAKAKSLASDETEIYTVLLATHPKSIIPKELDRIVKYRDNINKSFQFFNDSDEIKTRAIININKSIQSKNCIHKGFLDGGQSFGIGTDVYYWLIKA